MLDLLKLGLIKVNDDLDVREIYRSFTRVSTEESGSVDLLKSCGTLCLVYLPEYRTSTQGVLLVTFPDWSR